jgi:hypothetical protein
MPGRLSDVALIFFLFNVLRDVSAKLSHLVAGRSIAPETRAVMRLSGDSQDGRLVKRV